MYRLFSFGLYANILPSSINQDMCFPKCTLTFEFIILPNERRLFFSFATYDVSECYWYILESPMGIRYNFDPDSASLVCSKRFPVGYINFDRLDGMYIVKEFSVAGC